MTYLSDLATQAVRFGLMFNQVLITGKSCPRLHLAKDLRRVTSYLWQEGQGGRGSRRRLFSTLRNDRDRA